MANWVRYPLPLFWAFPPWRACKSGGAIPHKGYLSDTSAIPHDNKANGCDTPLCDTISKRYCAIWGLRAFKGGVSNGGVSRSGLVLPFLSFLGLSRFFWDFPICSGMVRGFPRFVTFLFLGLLRAPTRNSPKSPYEEQSRKGPRHNLDLSRKKWETPGFGNPPV